ncbi:hypothetical protein GSI_11482 [Ganoderma sinense ZZ0214-1]|uniref:Uncharacterized protein n=1 Tax=Ganoderma sinense ZZ0214-1 TaxID=1077348 RepID=A0A2G8RW46_9APHY|nr:hypothetical protein GSI_11482 [Ganoderma sinense ZZ0214-1]
MSQSPSVEHPTVEMRLQPFALPRVILASVILVLHAGAAPSIQELQDAPVISVDNPLVHFHGRWDASPGTWWAGSGFKLHIQDLTSLTLNLGPHTTSPLASIGVSVNYEPFYTVNVSQGSNVIPLHGSSGSTSTISTLTGSSESGPEAGPKTMTNKTIVRVNVESWQNNRINLETIVLNRGAKLLPYVPSKLAFQFIGDSLSAGQYLPQGVDQAWPFLTGEFFGAEHNVNAQPGAALIRERLILFLKDIVSYGNEHGISYQYFKVAVSQSRILNLLGTEDTGYFYTTDHNYTTPWNFLRDHPEPTHVVVHIGANDASQNVTADAFVQTFQTFLGRLRGLYPAAPLFVFTPWGWPSADGSISYYYDGQYERIVRDRLRANIAHPNAPSNSLPFHILIPIGVRIYSPPFLPFSRTPGADPGVPTPEVPMETEPTRGATDSADLDGPTFGGWWEHCGCKS